MTSAGTAAFLDDLFACYPGQPILLLWDRASWHKGSPVMDVLAAHPTVQTVYFPPASPDLNSQEHAWSLARAHVSHNHTLPDLPTLRDAFLRYLGKTTFHFAWLEQYAPPILFRQA